MKALYLLLPVGALLFTGCIVNEVNQAMECNRCAIQRSTEAIQRNVDALDRVTANLQQMQES